MYIHFLNIESEEIIPVNDFKVIGIPISSLLPVMLDYNHRGLELCVLISYMQHFLSRR